MPRAAPGEQREARDEDAKGSSAHEAPEGEFEGYCPLGGGAFTVRA